MIIIVGLFYYASDVTNDEVILITYNAKGIPLCAINIEGIFNDCEYKLNGILNTDLTVSISDSIYYVDWKYLTTKFRQSYNLQVDSSGQILKTNVKNLTESKNN